MAEYITRRPNAVASCNVTILRLSRLVVVDFRERDQSLNGHEVVVIDATDCVIGSTDAEVARAVSDWQDHLLDLAYTEHFESWIRKERPAHHVALGSYGIGTYPVTNGDYQRCLDETGAASPASIHRGGPPDHPVWDPDLRVASHYLDWLSERSGLSVRLPTEAEWEHAARGGDRREFPWGDEFDSGCCNTSEAGIGTTTPVVRYTHAASPFGLVDLAGNVEEWTSTRYGPYPGGEPVEDDLTEALGDYLVLRGGSFNRGGDLARCARRHGPYPSADYVYIGFRIAVSLP